MFWLRCDRCISPFWLSWAPGCAGRTRGTGHDPSAPDSWRRLMKTCSSNCWTSRQRELLYAESHRWEPWESLAEDMDTVCYQRMLLIISDMKSICHLLIRSTPIILNRFYLHGSDFHLMCLQYYYHQDCPEDSKSIIVMLTWCGIYFEEAQIKLQNELLFFKQSPPLLRIQAADPHIPALPLSLAHEQLLYPAHSHQSLREHSIRAHVETQWFTGKPETHHLILTPTGDVTPQGFVYGLCWPNLPVQITIPLSQYGFLDTSEWICYRIRFQI